MKILSQDIDEVIIRCDVETQSPRALGVLDESQNLMWLPFSQIEIIDIITDVEYELSIPRWLAEEKEIV